MKIENKDMPIYPDRWDANSTGLTKREHFAAMAMQGLCGQVGYSSFEDMAYDAVRAADALLVELAK